MIFYFLGLFHCLYIAQTLDSTNNRTLLVSTRRPESKDIFSVLLLYLNLLTTNCCMKPFLSRFTYRVSFMKVGSIHCIHPFVTTLNQYCRQRFLRFTQPSECLVTPRVRYASTGYDNAFGITLTGGIYAVTFVAAC